MRGFFCAAALLACFAALVSSTLWKHRSFGLFGGKLSSNGNRVGRPFSGTSSIRRSSRINNGRGRPASGGSVVRRPVRDDIPQGRPSTDDTFIGVNNGNNNRQGTQRIAHLSTWHGRTSNCLFSPCLIYVPLWLYCLYFRQHKWRWKWQFEPRKDHRKRQWQWVSSGLCDLRSGNFSSHMSHVLTFLSSNDGDGNGGENGNFNRGTRIGLRNGNRLVHSHERVHISSSAYRFTREQFRTGPIELKHCIPSL